MKINNIQILKYLSIISFVILFLLIITSGIDSYFTSGDESGYFLNLEIIDKYGFSTDFLRNFSGMAGPLHPMLHWILRPITGAIPPAARLVNFVILGLIIWQFRGALGYRILFIPMTFICAGYAMTELPAMLFLTLSIMLIITPKHFKFSHLYIYLSGILLSFAIAGRWNYLAILPFFWIWVSILNFKENKLDVLFFILNSSIFPAWILYAWGGISPPEVQIIEGFGTFDIAPQHLILSSCFAALMVIILCPKWLFELRKNSYLFTYLSISVFISNSFLSYYTFLPAKAIFNKITLLSPQYGELIQLLFANLFGSLSICLGLVFFYNLFLHALKRKNDWNYLFFAICIVVILFTSIKTTHVFSSRYPYQALPFLLLVLAYEEKNEVKWWEIALAIGGIIWGILTWISYQHIYY